MDQSIIDKIKLLENEKQLIERAIKVGICPVCGEKVEQRDISLGFGSYRVSIICTANINHYDSSEFVEDYGEIDADGYY